MAEKPRRTRKSAKPQEIENNSDLVKFIREEMKEDVNHLENKIDTKCQTIEVRIDALDESIRGNGRIGYSEQIRNLNKKFWILMIAVIWLGGFELGGVTLKSWLYDFFNHEEHQLEQQERQESFIEIRPAIVNEPDKVSETEEPKSDVNEDADSEDITGSGYQCPLP